VRQQRIGVAVADPGEAIHDLFGRHCLPGEVSGQRRAAGVRADSECPQGQWRLFLKRPKRAGKILDGLVGLTS
jgi:hypothetical protein